MHPTASRLAAVHRYLMPDVDEASFGTFINAHLVAEKVGPARVHELYEEYCPGAYSLPDQGYIARVHPLELWLLGYLLQHTQASFNEAVTASN
ncbi:hypothetical protein, partial [Pseudomonas viridiflava]|uniref:hypothetical protein n=1 Tax=Pseudomonas viridiflava TaxID=33069 RepID=UPI0013DF599C